MDKLRQFLKEDPSHTLWEYLKETSKPIMIYGMGDGAEKIITVLEKKGIEYKDIFASDGFVRGHSFRGKRVKSFSEIKEQYENFIILLSFASKQPETVQMLHDLSEKYELYAPDVNVSGDYTEVFDREYYEKHANELSEAFSLFEQEAKEIFALTVDFKISGKLCYLKEIDRHLKPCGSYYNMSGVYSYIDLGAYNGDTLKNAMEIYPNLTSAYAVEPDEKNFRKLSAYADTLDIDVHVYNNAAWNDICELTLHMGFGMNTTLGNIGNGMQKKKDKIVKTITADSITQSADVVKYDVEGSECEALEGTRRIITEHNPVLIVSVYHNNNDLYRLPLLINSYGKYKFHLNRKPCIPAWELEIIAVSEKHGIKETKNV
ncbi:MAG: FkbM family methyltransferase [Clostridia bacterium]|nr:FkbM family methyltransferase [Clostridia bacterium]